MKTPRITAAVILLISSLTLCVATAAETEDKISEWKGFHRVDFKLGEQACYVVAPKTPAEGKPWVWRARFPGFHSEIDVELLKRGFHIAHINTNGLLGNPVAMEHWDQFYDHMTGKRGLAKRMALEGVSRGGLFVYRWATRHPQRVTCIYADTPVCDFKSWPGGKGKGVGSAGTWQTLLKHYEFTEQQALDFKENPIDVLAPIAKQGIPLMHIVSENDRVVPPKENTYILQQRYQKLGGKMTVISVKEGSEKSKGHHFTLLPEHRERVVEFIFAACSDSAKPEPSAFAGQGIMVGEVSANSALIQLRLTTTDQLVEQDLLGLDGVVEFTLTEASSDPQIVAATSEHDFIARVEFSGLKPGTQYHCKTRIGVDKDQLNDGPAATFRTLPGKESSDAVRFIVVTGMNYAKFHGDTRIDKAEHLLENNTKLPDPYTGSDKDLGYPALEAILKQKPDFFVGTGDNIYYDTPNDPQAKTISELRQKWHEQFVQPRYRDLFASVPTYWMVDDHDYRTDDCDNTGDYKPSPELGQRIMLEQLPYAKTDADKPLTYRTHRISKDLQIWLPEGRIYRSPNAMEDGPTKTIWGAEQKAWIKKTLGESDAKYKLFISATPMIGPDDLRKKDNHTNVGGFRNERDDFFAFLKESGVDKKGFYFICGDRHWQYHSVDPSGLEEFSCGALIDANARLGRKPGDPKSTDAEGLIKQPYYQTPRSGGFLMVEVKPEGDTDAKLKVTWHDEHGETLHTTEKN